MKLCFYACRFCSLIPRLRAAFRCLQYGTQALRSFPSLAESWAGPGNEASPALPYCKRREAGRGPGNEATFFDCKGYHEVMDGAVLSTTGLTFLTSFIPSPAR